MKIGFHIPYSGNINRLKKRIAEKRGNTFQFFARSLRGGEIQKVKDSAINHLHEHLKMKKVGPIVIHAPYSYNLAKSSTEDVELMIEDLKFAERFRSPYYVINPGYYKDLHPIEAIENVKRNLIYVLENVDWYGEILIKNMAGAGTELCSTLQEWNEMISFHPQVKGAIDFARIYASGYFFGRKEDSDVFYEEIEDEIGWDKIKVCYINDHERGCGSVKNKYIPLGEGTIGLQGYEHILSNEKIREKIWIVENMDDLSSIDRCIEYLVSFYK